MKYQWLNVELISPSSFTIKTVKTSAEQSVKDAKETKTRKVKFALIRPTSSIGRGDYPGFCNIKQLGVSLLAPLPHTGQDAS